MLWGGRGRSSSAHAPAYDLAVHHQDGAHGDAALKHALPRLGAQQEEGLRRQEVRWLGPRAVVENPTGEACSPAGAGTRELGAASRAQVPGGCLPGPRARRGGRTSLMASSRNFLSSAVGSGTLSVFPWRRDGRVRRRGAGPESFAASAPWWQTRGGGEEGALRRGRERRDAGWDPGPAAGNAFIEIRRIGAFQ